MALHDGCCITTMVAYTILTEVPGMCQSLCGFDLKHTRYRKNTHLHALSPLQFCLVVNQHLALPHGCSAVKDRFSCIEAQAHGTHADSLLSWQRVAVLCLALLAL